MESLVCCSRTCCICFEEITKVVELFPCRHSNICASCTCRLEKNICPTCRQEVDLVGVNFDLRGTNWEESESLSYPTTFIPLTFILEYRRQTIRRLVASTFQVYFVGSSGIPLSNVASKIFENFAFELDPKLDLKEREHHFEVQRRRTFEDDSTQQSRNNNEANIPEYLLEAFFDMNECTREYSANAFVKGSLIRFKCFAFWEFLRILRSTEVPDGILPDLIVTCVDLCNEKCFQETIEMQEVMTEVYERHKRKLYNVWLHIRRAQYKKKQTEKRLERVFASMPQVVWPCIILVVPKSLSTRDSTNLVDIIRRRCTESRQRLFSDEISGT